MGVSLVLIVHHFVVEPEFLQMQLKEENGSCEDMMSGLWDPYSVISASGYSECQIHSRSKEAESRSPSLSETRRSYCQGGGTTSRSPWGPR